MVEYTLLHAVTDGASILVMWSLLVPGGGKMFQACPFGIRQVQCSHRCKMGQDSYVCVMVCLVRQVQELADMLKGVSQRLSEGQRGWEGDRRALEGQLHRAEQSLRECQASCDQLRSVCQLTSAFSCNIQAEEDDQEQRNEKL